MPYALADYQGERAVSLRFELKTLRPNGGEYVMPFGRGPLTGKNGIDKHSHFASLEAGACIALPGQDDAYEEIFSLDQSPAAHVENLPRRVGGLL
jgi:hypothetical protein